MVSFGKGKNLPEQVSDLRKSGMTNNQIIEELQRKGANPQDIFDAISHADMMAQSPEAAGTMPPPPEGAAYEREEYSPAGQSNDESRFEEIAEAIIDEKWEELVGAVDKIVGWKEKVEDDITSLKSEVEHLKESFKNLQDSIIGKVKEYDIRMSDVSSDLKAVENVFKDTIPSFTENVKQLDEIVSKIRKKK